MNWTLFLAMIAALETGGHPDPDNAIGDGGRALGRYQIHKCFVDDVNRMKPILAYNYFERTDPVFAELIVIKWHSHYAELNNDLGDYVAMARRHNGGPRGHLKRSTEEYGRRAQAWINKHKQEFSE